MLKTEISSQLKRIDRAMTALVLDQPFFATLALRLNIRETDEYETFATDGKELLVNPVFCGKLTDSQIKSVIAHEVLHCAMGHIWRAPGDADCFTWNMAADQEANGILIEANGDAKRSGRADPFPLPKSAYWESRFDGWASEKVYRELDRNKQDGKTPGLNGPGMGEVIPCKKESIEASRIKEEWDKAVVQAVSAAKGRGSIPKSMTRLADKIMNPQKSWKQILRDFLRDLAADDWSWGRANMRYADTGFMLPELRSEKAGRIVFAIDTSGSINKNIISRFISEAQNALDELNPSELMVVACDSKVHSIDRFERGDIVKSLLRGGGGTDFKPVFNAMETEEKIDALVYLTDLEGSFPKVGPDYPVVWVSTGNKKAPFGETIKFNEEN